ncbi:hypothetical protein SAFG77S_11949 [Streptomyces afghaniensis]
MTQLTSNRIAVTFAKPERQRRNPHRLVPTLRRSPCRVPWTDPTARTATDRRSGRADRTHRHLRARAPGPRGHRAALSGRPSSGARHLQPAGRATRRVRRLPCPRPAGATRPPWTGSRTSRSGPTTRSTTRSSPTGRAGSATARHLDPDERTGDRRCAGHPWGVGQRPAEGRVRGPVRGPSCGGPGPWAASVLFTSYTAGTTPVSPHLSWAQTYENDVVIDWLFAQSRQPAALHHIPEVERCARSRSTRTSAPLRTRSRPMTALIALATTIGMALTLLTATAAPATAAGIPSPTTASLEAADGPLATAAYTVPCRAGTARARSRIPRPGAGTPGVVLMPGYQGAQENLRWLAPRLASWGFVIDVAGQHAHRRSRIARPQIRAAGTQLLALGKAPRNPLSGKLNGTLGAAGHSIGRRWRHGGPEDDRGLGRACRPPRPPEGELLLGHRAHLLPDLSERPRRARRHLRGALVQLHVRGRESSTSRYRATIWMTGYGAKAKQGKWIVSFFSLWLRADTRFSPFLCGPARDADRTTPRWSPAGWTPARERPAEERGVRPWSTRWSWSR